MKLFHRKDQPVLNSNMQLYAGDTLQVTLFFNVSQHVWLTTKMVDEATNKIDVVVEEVFEPGLRGPRIRILDLHSAELEKEIDGLQRKIAKLEIKSSILRLLGFKQKEW